MDRASNKERLYQCLTCKYTEVCTLDEEAEDRRGLCKTYEKSEEITAKCRERGTFKMLGMEE